VVQRGEGFGFALEPSQPIGVGGEVRRHDLDGDVSVEHGVARAIDLTHAAGTDGSGDFIRAEAGAGLE